MPPLSSLARWPQPHIPTFDSLELLDGLNTDSNSTKPSENSVKIMMDRLHRYFEDRTSDSLCILRFWSGFAGRPDLVL
jgi:hypothetical protein